MKNRNGITLIALIITVILMIILVGVTVNIALNGGLFTTARQAAEDTEYEADYETLQVAVVAAMAEDTGITQQSLKNNLPGGWSVPGNDEEPYTAESPNQNKFIVYKNGNITAEENEVTGGNETTDSEWWKLTDAEKNEISPHSNYVAEGGKTSVQVVIQDGLVPDIVGITNGDTGYYFILTTKYAEDYGEAYNTNIEIKKWYCLEDASSMESSMVEYTGEFPISIENLDNIYSETYLNRVIENFNK